MATVNPWKKFQNLLPQTARYTVTITKKNTDGTSLARRRDGSIVRLKGDAVPANKKAWVENKMIIGEAPGLPEYIQYV